MPTTAYIFEEKEVNLLVAFLALRRSLLFLLVAVLAGLVQGFLQGEFAGIRFFQLVALEAFGVLFFVVASLAVFGQGLMRCMVKCYRTLLAGAVVQFDFVRLARQGQAAKEKDSRYERCYQCRQIPFHLIPP
jgi:hypothetical protein